MQGSQFLLFHEAEFLDEIDEVLERRVQVRLLLEHDHFLEVLMVDVRVDAKQTLENGLGNREEVLRKRNADLRREEQLVVELILHPGHEIVDVARCGAFDRLLDRMAVGPVVLVLGPGGHQNAGGVGAELGDRSVEHVDLIEEIDD